MAAARDPHPLLAALDADVIAAGGEVVVTTPDILGKISGKTWREVAQSTMRVVTEAALVPDISAQDYAEGFEALGRRFLELAAHAGAAQDRPDWRIVLGFETDTEKV